MNHTSQGQQQPEGRHDDDTAIADFLTSLMDYTPTIPDELVEHYLAKSGFQCPDVRLRKLLTLLRHSSARRTTTDRWKLTTKKRREVMRKSLISPSLKRMMMRKTAMERWAQRLRDDRVKLA
ncbi:PREDICTED: transcription initiation factor TFIID subunit 10-like isoform X2 [Ipomoea nil]|nr:PREDICTED: transcription initiation factor TFIID subunit 10-like isoform X2 [Ipomoea nil]XP_019181355.1 PREDICTED: transcription initiation factor TFIID subunit 10-like isoform X2 [Ipomoea nil]XP_019181356.1 PREDICTED: transcription initiation factor TFIID subunit 10-like isoform X2 [Ipomoea nil]